MPGKHTSGPVGLARLLPARVRLRTVLDRARTASADRRNRMIAAAVAVLLIVAGGVASVVGGPAQWPLFVAPNIPIGDGAAIGVGDPTGSPEPAPAALPVSEQQPATPGTPTTGPSSAPAATGSPESAPRPVGSPPRSKPVVPRSTAPAVPAGPPTADYVVSGSWDTGFIGGVLLTNPTDRPLPWRVVVTHDPDAGVRVNTAWNATLHRDGSTATFTGEPLAPGATLTFGFEAGKRRRGPVLPTSCTVNGTPCTVR